MNTAGESLRGRSWGSLASIMCFFFWDRVTGRFFSAWEGVGGSWTALIRVDLAVAAMEERICCGLEFRGEVELSFFGALFERLPRSC